MSVQIPSTMLAAQLDAVGQPLVVREVPVPKPGPGQVLVRMAASPINPSDLGFMLGGYGFKGGLPTGVGNEGSGVVVATGSGFMARRLQGKRIACFGRPGYAGAWAEYLLTNAELCVPLPKGITLEQGATSLINPLTALAFMDLVRIKKYRAFVNTAGASALGKMLIRLSQRQGVPLISVVRRPGQVAELREMGAQYVVDSSEAGFPEQLKSLADQLGAQLLLDAVGGNMTGQLIAAAPRGGTILSYGRLSAEPCIIEPGELIMHNKRLVGFLLSDWMRKKNLLQILRDIRRVQGLLSGDLQTEVKRHMPLADVAEALKAYKEEMSGGKTLLVMGADR
jgi:NADPH:quinone reductase-like Zn-dependent oxidoreductase